MYDTERRWRIFERAPVCLRCSLCAWLTNSRREDSYDIQHLSPKSTQRQVLLRLATCTRPPVLMTASMSIVFPRSYCLRNLIPVKLPLSLPFHHPVPSTCRFGLFVLSFQQQPTRNRRAQPSDGLQALVVEWFPPGGDRHCCTVRSAGPSR